MQYRCSLKSLHTFQGDPNKFQTLCDQCNTADCDNPIEFVSISIMGINSNHRVYKTSTGGHQVMQCDGFSLGSGQEDDDE